MKTTYLLLTVELLFASSSLVDSCEDMSHHIEKPAEFLRYLSPATSPSLRYLPNNKLHLTLDYDVAKSAGHDASDIVNDLFSIHTDLTFFPNWSPYPPITENITAVTVMAWHDHDKMRRWNDPDRVLQVLPNVENVYWDGPGAITESILQVLEKRMPRPKLFYKLKTYNDRSSLPHHILVNSTILHSIDIVLRYSYYRDEESLPFVFTLLQTCRNLKQLSMKIYENSCEPTNSDFGFNFASSPNTTLPALEVLKVDGYRFDALEDGTSEWMHRRKEQHAIDSPHQHLATNLEMWKRVMDFSALHTLEILGTNQKTLTSLGGDLLTGLQHLSITGWNYDWGGGKQTTREFVRDLKNSLESLEIHPASSSFQDAVDIVTENHCSTLKNFKFAGRIEFPSPNLDLLLDKCLKLESLDLDISWPKTTVSIAVTDKPQTKPQWDPSLLAIPRKSPGIKHILVHFPSPSYQEYDSNAPLEYKMHRDDWDAKRWELERLRRRAKVSDIVDDIINKHTTLDLFRELRSREIEGPLRIGEVLGLQRLSVFMGDWEIRAAELGGFVGRGDRVRVAFYECSINHDGNEICGGSQTRSVEYGGDIMEYIS